MKRADSALVIAAACAALAAGCGLDLDLERMLEQPRFEAYEAAYMFEDGSAMRVPPEGTVPRNEPVLPPAIREGVVDGRPVEVVPIVLDRAALARGRDRFERFCAPCHGVNGHAVTEVAANMTLRPPPSLITLDAAARRPGHMYRVVRDGYGLMPDYAVPLGIADRWRVVAYVQALQLSRRVPLSELPQQAQAQARRRLP